MGLGSGRQHFPDTRWSLIQEAREEGRGLDEWCQSYWLPVREYLRALGCQEDEADEVTQKFFQSLLRQGPERLLPEHLTGAFRAFLKRSVKNFWIDCKIAEYAKIRGGSLQKVGFDQVSDVLPSASANPSQEFDRQWVLRVMEIALERLREEAERSGRGAFFQELVPFLDGRHANRAEVIERLQMNDVSFRAALYRYRRRYRALIEAEVKETVSGEEEFAEEMRHILGAWA